jgi:hypothetical protein
MKKNKSFLIGLLLPFAAFSQTLTSVSPSSVTAAGQTLDVMITGNNTHFDPNGGTTLLFQYHYKTGGTLVVLNSFTVVSPTSLKATITVPANTETSDYDIYVENMQDGQMYKFSSFHVNGIPAKPAIQINYQSEIFAHKTMNVTIHGYRYPYGYATHFNDSNGTNATKVIFKSLDPIDDIVMNSMTIMNDSTIIVNITTPARASAQSVCVSDNIDGQMCIEFKVYQGCPSYFTTSYDPATNAFTVEQDSITSLSTTFFWNFGDGTTSTDALPTHTYAKDSLYTVCLLTDSCWYCRVIGKDDNGNPVLKTKGFTFNVVPFKGSTSGIILNGNIPSMTVYPNPADNLITVTTFQGTAINTMLSIYSIEGKLILQQALVKEKTELDVSTLTKGIYIMQVTENNKTERVKFIKY